MNPQLHVLFLCTGNSARSILAEGLLTRLGGARFVAASAGSAPKGVVHPQARRLLRSWGLDDGAFASKAWAGFAGPGAPALDIVITVCDAVAEEPCPVWPGAPITAHWSVPNPAVAPDDEAEAAFADVAAGLRARIERLVALPVGNLDRATLEARVREIGDRAGWES